MKKKIVLITITLIISIFALSGCFEIFSNSNGKTIYKSHPTKISYEISYGYKINCTGAGKYSIKYNCDVPELINGEILSTIIQDNNYEDIVLATNNYVKQWNITGYDGNNYNLGISAIVEAESYVVSDLSGSDAKSIDDIKNQYPHFINQYCKAQSNDSTIFINPNDPEIASIAKSIKSSSGTNNSFIVAKELFIWLKQHTTYKTHVNNIIQPAELTFQSRTGDCDDLSFLYISLCRAVSIPARFIRGFLIEEDSAISHAWVEIFVGENIGNNGWIPVECAGVSGEIKKEINQNFGVETSEHLRLFTDDGSNESINVSLTGLYLVKYNPNINLFPESYAEINNYVELKSNELVIDENNNRFYQ